MRVIRRSRKLIWSIFAAAVLLWGLKLLNCCSIEDIIIDEELAVDGCLNHRRILVGIVSDEEQLHTIGKAAMETWIKDSPWKVLFFVGRETNTDGFDNVIKLDCKNEYPPIRKIFSVWDYYYRHRDQYDMFVQMDSDSFMNVEKMNEVLQALSSEGHNYHYVGSKAYGREYERHLLGLDGRSYCVGMGYIIGKEVLNRFGGHIFDCLDHMRTNHSDTELARCIYKYNPDMECRESPIPLQPIYYSNIDGVIHGRKFMSTMQMSLDISATPPSIYFNAPLIHPIKKPEAFYQLNEQVQKYLRPVQNEVRDQDESATISEFKAAQNDFKKNCVNNPVRQIQKNNIYIKECVSPRPDVEIDTTKVPIFVLNLPDKKKNFDNLYEKFSKMGYHPQRFIAVNGVDINMKIGKMKHGEIGYRETMKRLLKYAIEKNIDRMIVLDDDAVPHKQFDQKFQEILEDDRCGGYMFTQHRGGILLLGSSIWVNGTYPIPSAQMGGWNIIMADIKNSTYNSMCFNACNKTYGSFGVFMHKSTYQPILDWLETSIVPYDNVFSFLSDLGYIVRGAYPNLIIQDVAHESQVDPTRTPHQTDRERRAKIHRWVVEDYLFDKE